MSGPRPENLDPGGRWLWLALVSFALMLASLYLGQGLPSLVYVVMVLGLLVLSLVSLIIHHLYDVVSIGQRIRHLVGQSRTHAAIVLTLGLVAVALKLLGIW